MVEAVKGSAQQYLHGLKDSIYGITHIYQLNRKVNDQNRKKRQRLQDDLQTRRYRNRFEARRPLHSTSVSIQKTTSSSKSEVGLLRGLAMNTAMSLMIWGSLWMFHGYLAPWLQYRLEVGVNTFYVKRQTELYVCFQKLMSSSTEDDVKVPDVWFMDSILPIFFYSLWVLPLHFISKIVNSLYFVGVSSAIYQYYRGQPRGFCSTGRMLADFIFSSVVEAIFLVQANLASGIPYVGHLSFLLCGLHYSLLYALYAFEYKWFNMGLDFRLRVLLVETHWPYFCGFGTPLFVLINLTYYSVVVSGCIFSFLFPFFIISAIKAETPPQTPAVRMRIFDVCMLVCDFVCKKFLSSKMGGDGSQSTAAR